MSKNLNLKVDEETFYEFHRIKGLLKAGTNQDCIIKLLKIADAKMMEFKTKSDQDKYIQVIAGKI